MTRCIIIILGGPFFPFFFYFEAKLAVKLCISLLVLKMLRKLTSLLVLQTFLYSLHAQEGKQAVVCPLKLLL